MLEYGKAKANISVERHDIEASAKAKRTIVWKVGEFTTWKGDTIEKMLEATGFRHVVEPGDKVTITIEIGEDAHLDNHDEDTPIDSKVGPL